MWYMGSTAKGMGWCDFASSTHTQKVLIGKKKKKKDIQ